MKKLVDEYKDSLRKLNKLIDQKKSERDDLKKQGINDERIIKLTMLIGDLGYLASNLKYSIQWMNDARQPNSLEGIDNIKAVKSYE